MNSWQKFSRPLRDSLGNLHFRLMLMFLLIIIPLAVLIVSDYFNQYRAGTAQANQEVLHLTREIALNQNLWVENTNNLLATLAQISHLLVSDQAFCSQTLTGVLDSNPQVRNLVITDHAGRVLCQSRRDTSLANADTQQILAESLENNEVIGGHYHWVPTEDGLHLLFPYSLPQNQDQAAWITAVIGAEWLNQTIAGLDLPAGSTLTMVDPQGVIVARFPNPELWVGRNYLHHPITQAAIDEEEGTLEAKGPDRQNRLYGFSTLRRNSAAMFYIAVGMPPGAIYTHANQELLKDLGLLTILALLVSALEWFGSNRLILHPIRRLAKTVDVLASGDLSARSHLDSGGYEIRALAAAFDQMAQALQSRQQRLETAQCSLAESEDRYRRLAENAPDIIYRYRFTEPRGFEYVNPIVTQITGYTPQEHYADPDLGTKLVHPDDLEILANAAATPQALIILRWLHKDGRILWTEQRNTPIFDKNGVLVAIEGIARDITLRKNAEKQIQAQAETNARLLEQAQRRTRQLEKFYEISAALRPANNQELLVKILLEKSCSAMEAQTSGLIRRSEHGLIFQTANEAPTTMLPIASETIWECLRRGEALFVENRQKSGHTAGPGRLSEPAAFILTPIRAGETGVGALFYGYNAPQEFKEDRTWIARSIAAIAGNAIHRSSILESLEQHVADRTRELNTLYSVTSVAGKSLDLSTALGEALDQVLAAIDSPAGAIFLHEPNDRIVRILAQCGLPAPLHHQLQVRSIQGDNFPEARVVNANEPLFIADINAEYPGMFPTAPASYLCYLGLPMRVQGKVVGVLSIVRPIGQNFNLEELSLLSSIADHLGLRVVSHRLHAQAQHMAVVEERSRLARELHDSIIQMLYSANLFTNGSRQFLQQGKTSQVGAYLEQIEELVGQSLREMRMLVHELRPPVLEEQGLIGALQQRLDAVERRAGLNATLSVDDSLWRRPYLGKACEEGLYKIAIEALNNSIKHAHAKSIQIGFELAVDHLQMTIEDDGAGFDPTQPNVAGGMGLISMRERADAMNARLSIETQPGMGVCILVEVPTPCPERLCERLEPADNFL